MRASFLPEIYIPVHAVPPPVGWLQMARVDVLAVTSSCSLCDARFATRNLLFKHLRDAHAWSPPCRESDEERVALVFGYFGDRYHGLQRNDTEDALATVEVTNRH